MSGVTIDTTIVACALTALFTGVGHYMWIGRNTASRTELSEVVKTNAAEHKNLAELIRGITDQESARASKFYERMELLERRDIEHALLINQTRKESDLARERQNGFEKELHTCQREHAV